MMHITLTTGLVVVILAAWKRTSVAEGDSIII